MKAVTNGCVSTLIAILFFGAITFVALIFPGFFDRSPEAATAGVSLQGDQVEPQPASITRAEPAPTPEPVQTGAAETKAEEVVRFEDAFAQPEFFPGFVHLTQAQIVPLELEGQRVGEVTLPAGTRAISQGVSPSGKLKLAARSYVLIVDHTETDFLARWQENRRARLEAAAAEARAKEEASKARIERIAREAGESPSEGFSVPWYSVDEYLKARLHDPDSLKYGQCYGPMLVELEDGFAWQVRVNYRARNGFGAYVKQSAIAQIRHEQVIAWNPE